MKKGTWAKWVSRNGEALTLQLGNESSGSNVDGAYLVELHSPLRC